MQKDYDNWQLGFWKQFNLTIWIAKFIMLYAWRYFKPTIVLAYPITETLGVPNKRLAKLIRMMIDKTVRLSKLTRFAYFPNHVNKILSYLIL